MRIEVHPSLFSHTQSRLLLLLLLVMLSLCQSVSMSVSQSVSQSAIQHPFSNMRVAAIDLIFMWLKIQPTLIDTLSCSYPLNT